MMNENDNLHKNFNIGNNLANSNMVNTYSNNVNSFTKSYSRTYVNNNDTIYRKEESIGNDKKV